MVRAPTIVAKPVLQQLRLGCCPQTSSLFLSRDERGTKRASGRVCERGRILETHVKLIRYRSIATTRKVNTLFSLYLLQTRKTEIERLLTNLVKQHLSGLNTTIVDDAQHQAAPEQPMDNLIALGKRHGRRLGLLAALVTRWRVIARDYYWARLSPTLG